MTAVDLPVVTYECPIAGVEHAVPGPDVRIMMTGDAGFVIACDCSEESLDEADETPHPTVDHLVNVYGPDPSPEEWVEWVLDSLTDHRDAGVVGTVLAHPACMQLADGFEAFEELCSAVDRGVALSEIEA